MLIQKNISFQHYNYEACLEKDIIWSLEEALNYLAAFLSNKENYCTTDGAYKGFLCIRNQLLNTLRQSIDKGRLLVYEKYHDVANNETGASHHDIDYEKSTVSPLNLITWALDNKIDLPEHFKKYAAEKKIGKSIYEEGVRLKRSTIHHERCRAVAELLWSLEPETTIAEMARRNEIIKFGCEGEGYDVRTICRWLFSLKDGRRPGRRKKTG